MFKAANPYDDIVNNTTDENLTGENWELILNLCDKVNDEGEQGARNVVAALLKRLAHRNANVQLYSLALADALVKNCKLDLHREIASRAFTGGLERIISDRTTHDKVKKRALSLVKEWAEDFKENPDLGLMEECYQSLKAKHYQFETPEEAPPPQVDDEIRRREEEELQRVLEMSVHDKGGRNWDGYAGGSSSGVGSSGSSHNLPDGGSGSGSAGGSKVHTTRLSSYAATTSAGPRSPTPPTSASTYSLPTPRTSYPTIATATAASAAPASSAPVPATAPAAAPAPAVSPSPSKEATISRVRALHTFEPTQPGELGFEKGDIIKVIDRGYKDWWRGQLRGKTGIFPVNYVEPMPELTAVDLQKEAEMEAQVFAQAASIDRLLNMLRGLDPQRDNLADNEEIQELYRSTLTLRPKIVKLIDKYSQKRVDLMGMNESFLKARKIFDRMMEDSLAVHNPGVSLYDYTQAAQARPGYDSRGSSYGWPQGYGYNYPAEQYAQDGQYVQQQQYPPQSGHPGYDPNVYAAGQQPGYEQYPAQSGYQYGPQAQQQPQDGRAQYAENQQPYGQSPYPAPQGAAQYADPNAQQAVGYGQNPDQGGQYQDDNARAWAEYYAAQARAQEAQPASQASQAAAYHQQDPNAQAAQQPPPHDLASQSSQYAQQQQYGQTQAQPAAPYPTASQPPTAGEPGGAGRQDQPYHPQGHSNSVPGQYSAQPPAPSQAVSPPVSSAVPLPQQSQYTGGQSFDTQPRQDQPPQSPYAAQPPNGPGGPRRQGSIYQAQPGNPNSAPAAPVETGYGSGAAQQGSPPPPSDPNQYQSQYASMHQNFGHMSISQYPISSPSAPPGVAPPPQ